MENREQQILSEIKSMVASIRSQLEKLDAKMVEFHQAVDPEGFKTESINVIIDDIDMLAPPVEPEIVQIPLEMESHVEIPETVETVLQDEIDDDLPFGDLPVEVPQVEPDAEQRVAEPHVDEVPVMPSMTQDDDLPGVFDVPEVETVASKASAAAKPTINDSHSTDQAWRKDIPGSPVRDIRSAISLNDRVFFINNLFDEDAQAFVNALSSINAMTSLDEVVEFITSQYPGWNLNSEIVYRFMMAVRRKVN